MPDNPRRDFLSEYFHRHGDWQPSLLSKLAILSDHFDAETYRKLLKEMADMAGSRNKLIDAVETGGSAFEDVFSSLVKAVPSLREMGEVRPSHLVNRAVMDEAMGLKNYDALRGYTMGDEVAAGLACITMEPEVEALFDELKEEQQLANKLQGMMDELGGLEQEEKSIDDLMAELDQESEEGQQKAHDYQKQKNLIEQGQQRLQEGIDQAAQQLQEQLEAKKGQMQTSLQRAVDQATDDAEASSNVMEAWGLDPGTLRRMPFNKRMELAERINTDKFRRIAKLFGPMMRMAFAEQMRKTQKANSEIYDIEMGADLSRLLASELVNIRHPLLRKDFYRKFLEHALLQYKLRGKEKLAKGGIICMVDSSGSMGGDKEVWSKAVSLTLLQIARVQKRAFHACLFGSPGLLQTYDFSDTKNISIDTVLEFAELFMNSGPLRTDQRVATPDGWKPIGSLIVGDEVFGPDGQPTKVTGVYPQGQLSTYKVRFTDEVEVVCDRNHLWTVKEKGSRPWVTRPLHELMHRGIRYEHRGGGWYRYEVPITQPIELPHADLPVDPYLVGYMLGNGSFTRSSPGITSDRGDEVEWLKVLPAGITANNTEKRPGFCPQYQLVAGPRGSAQGIYGGGSPNPLTEALRITGLWGTRREDKFIPDTYLWASSSQRFALLQGLLDSDGTATANGRVEYATVSRALADDVMELAHGMGCLASIGTYQNPNRPRERVCYKVYIRIPPSMPTPFRLARYTTAWVPRQSFCRSIESVEAVGHADCVCIKVDREDGLFLTEGMVVTHNTDFVTPLSWGLDRVREQFDENGEIKADMVFITDGICGVPDKWLQEFKAEQERLAFRVYGVVIGGSPDSEPLKSICDGRVLTTQNLVTGDGLREMFRGV